MNNVLEDTLAFTEYTCTFSKIETNFVSRTCEIDIQITLNGNTDTYRLNSSSSLEFIEGTYLGSLEILDNGEYYETNYHMELYS